MLQLFIRDCESFQRRFVNIALLIHLNIKALHFTKLVFKKKIGAHS